MTVKITFYEVVIIEALQKVIIRINNEEEWI